MNRPNFQTKPMPPIRWHCFTPGAAVIALLAVEGMLLASQRFRWFPFNQQGLHGADRPGGGAGVPDAFD
jgi:hypothetical protein